MSAFFRLRDRHVRQPGGLRALSASGQLGYGIPLPAFQRGIARAPAFIGCDMGSIDPGPYYLGTGRMAASPAMARQDLALVLTAARRLDVPLLLGSAGTAGAAPHLEATLALVREIAREEGLRFRLASIRADVASETVAVAKRDGRLHPLGTISAPTLDEIAASRIVAQMGTEAFSRALEAGADVVIAGRACDTAIFAAIPLLLGVPPGPATHMAKIIECTSICCTPGGRDAMLATIKGESFVLESMNPDRHATPVSVAAHALYEQADPFTVAEPEGTLHLEAATYAAVDPHRTRVVGATWAPAMRLRVKVEGALRMGERAVLVAAAADPRFLAGIDDILAAVEATTRALVPGEYRFFPRVYGGHGVPLWPRPSATPAPTEAALIVECVAETGEAARGALSVFRQYLLHHGFPGRLSTGGNLAFPLTPPELDAGSAYRFSLYHLMEVDALAPLFPVTLENVG